MSLEDVADVLAGPPVEAARRLLGATLRGRGVTLRLVEVEAYAGPADPGSHAYRGRTARNAVMFGPPGHLYVYFTYGMHWCANVVCGPPGAASAVLLRAGAVVDGLDVARSRRPGIADRDLARGPARLAKTLCLTGEDNGVDVLDPAGPLVLSLADPVPAGQVATGPRVGLRLAAEVPWRFWIAGDPAVSAYRPATKRVAR
ncbi:MAG: DNA-3-methyladenine glycosylase [Mycobacteriales bacterium]